MDTDASGADNEFGSPVDHVKSLYEKTGYPGGFVESKGSIYQHSITFKLICMVTLLTPIRGYKTGMLTGNRDRERHEVILESGTRVWLYEDEFII